MYSCRSLNKKPITGMLIYYYKVCERKLWYFFKGLALESDNQDVKLGKYLDKTSYSNFRKNILIDNIINIDYIEKSKTLHEVKKSKKIEEASILQLKYYLYYLREKGISDLNGKLDYPLLRKSKKIELNEEDIPMIETTIESIYKIILNDRPPELTEKGICNKCAYKDMCWL